MISLNVLAYLTDGELATSGPASRHPRARRILLVSHSNSLFDLFALNGGTARFFADEFTDGTSVAELLAAGDPRARPTTCAPTR